MTAFQVDGDYGFFTMGYFTGLRFEREGKGIRVANGVYPSGTHLVHPIEEVASNDEATVVRIHSRSGELVLKGRLSVKFGDIDVILSEKGDYLKFGRYTIRHVVADESKKLVHLKKTIPEEGPRGRQP